MSIYINGKEITSEEELDKKMLLSGKNRCGCGRSWKDIKYKVCLKCKVDESKLKS